MARWKRGNFFAGQEHFFFFFTHVTFKVKGAHVCVRVCERVWCGVYVLNIIAGSTGS